jgi:hypothetical protein
VLATKSEGFHAVLLSQPIIIRHRRRCTNSVVDIQSFNDHSFTESDRHLPDLYQDLFGDRVWGNRFCLPR